MLEFYRCSQFARMAARDVFGLRYSVCDAWDRRYFDRVAAPIDGKNDRELRDLARSGVLKPGMILGILVPSSGYLDGTDSSGENIRYTHNALFLGVDGSDDLVFAEQFNTGVRMITGQEYYKRGLIPVEVLAPRTGKNGKSRFII